MKIWKVEINVDGGEFTGGNFISKKTIFIKDLEELIDYPIDDILSLTELRIKSKVYNYSKLEITDIVKDKSNIYQYRENVKELEKLNENIEKLKNEQQSLKDSLKFYIPF